MDINISTLSGAHTFLKTVSLNVNILDEIRDVIYTWSYTSEYNLEAIRNDLKGIIASVIFRYFQDKKDNEIYKAVSCVVYNEIYENLIPLIRGKFSKEDLFTYEKCQHFCKRNVIPGEFGSNVYNSIPFTAAVVELSVLDNYKSPLEKINCLCSTYDLIFAELKLALVSMISKHSEKECEIPVINNEEVVPILMLVVIKSKLLYLPSNLFYVNFFADHIIKENTNIRTILGVFETVVQKLMDVDETSLTADNELSPHLDVCQTIEIISVIENGERDDKEKSAVTLKDEEKKRLVSLITTSTEKDFIPLNLPKLFS